MLTLERKLYGKKAGIYCIINNVSGKVYIGQAIDLYNRVNYHRWHLNKNKHDNSKLQKSFNAHGESNFTVVVLETICLPEYNLHSVKGSIVTKLTEKEQFWMEFFTDCVKTELYNLAPAAGSLIGYKFSDEVRKKASERCRRNCQLYGPPVIPQESIEQKSDNMVNHDVSSETKEKLSRYFKNLSEEEKLRRKEKARLSKERTKNNEKGSLGTSKRVFKYKGVIQRGNTFRAIVYHDKKTIHLGTYATAEDAAKAYDDYIISNNINKPTNNIK